MLRLDCCCGFVISENVHSCRYTVLQHLLPLPCAAATIINSAFKSAPRPPPSAAAALGAIALLFCSTNALS
ncbi:hypothetical protein PIB30_058222, partial [Stylosanthes scabra]|nr:hypothetical protein [Stylosanthes scabra]